LLPLCRSTPWGAAAEAQLQDLGGLIGAARDRCSEDLPAIIRRRKRDRGQDWPHWADVDRSVVTVLRARAQQLNQRLDLHLQLSGLLGGAMDFGIPASRAFLAKLTTSPAVAAEALQSLGRAYVAVWAPVGPEATARLMAGLHHFLRSSPHPDSLTLAVVMPYERFPGCDDAAARRELWWHALGGGRFADVRRGVRFLDDPSRCVTAGAHGPVQGARHLAVVEFGLHEGPEQVGCASWRPLLLQEPGENFIVVDVPAPRSLAVARALHRAAVPDLTRWEGPLRSPASTHKEPQLCFRGYLRVGAGQEASVGMRVRALLDTDIAAGALIGSSRLFADPASMLAETFAIRSLQGLHDLVEGLVVLSPTKALLRPRGTQAAWEARLTELARSRPDEAVQRVRWRDGRHGGRTWAKPQLLDGHLRAAAQRAGASSLLLPGGVDPKGSFELKLPGALGPDPELLLGALMQAVAQHAGLHLVRAVSERSMRAGQWFPARFGDGSWNGSVRIQLGGLTEVASAAPVLRSFAIRLMGDSRILEVSSPYLDEHVALAWDQEPVFRLASRGTRPG